MLLLDLALHFSGVLDMKKRRKRKRRFYRENYRRVNRNLKTTVKNPNLNPRVRLLLRKRSKFSLLPPDGRDPPRPQKVDLGTVWFRHLPFQPRSNHHVPQLVEFHQERLPGGLYPEQRLVDHHLGQLQPLGEQSPQFNQNNERETRKTRKKPKTSMLPLLYDPLQLFHLPTHWHCQNIVLFRLRLLFLLLLSTHLLALFHFSIDNNCIIKLSPRLLFPKYRHNHKCLTKYLISNNLISRLFKHQPMLRLQSSSISQQSLLRPLHPRMHWP